MFPSDIVKYTFKKRKFWYVDGLKDKLRPSLLKVFYGETLMRHIFK